MNVLSVSITEAGRSMARRLPFEHVHGSLAETVRARWGEVDAFVCFCAVGIATRVTGRVGTDKHRDPAVVCVDEAGRWVVPVLGAHERGGNVLAVEVAGMLGATPVITTASEAARSGAPRDLVIGVGASAGAPSEEVRDLVRRALREAELAWESVESIATIDVKATEPGILALGVPTRVYPAERLRRVDIPTPSPVVEEAVGTPSVAEAAALLGAGPHGELVVAKQVSAHATVAVARRARPRGRLTLVGLGPGDTAHRTPAAEQAVRGADVVIGYRGYVAQASDLLTPEQEVVEHPIGDEVVRAKQAVAEAEAGRRVAVLCSGDAGVYAMASLVCELADDLDAELDVVPGVTAATAAAALLGAPLGHDFVVVSLSDLLTPWEIIARRVDAAGWADLVTVFYNPRSSGRPDHLARAREILLSHRPSATPVGVVTDAFRSGQRVEVATLGDLDPSAVGMTTTVVVGSSTTTVVGGRMVTPRGYRP